MSVRKKRSDVKSFLAGAAIGAGTAVGISYWMSHYPQSTPAQLRRNLALERALENARAAGSVSLKDSHRYVIFSDHHKGARNLADDFRFSEPTYQAALDYYYRQGYTLIILGDAEELWEEKIPNVIQAYNNILTSEARFYPDRYIRLSGNHDNAWKIEALVQQYLYPFFPGIHVRQELLFEFDTAGGKKGEILLIHGHQGTLDSDIFDFIPEHLLPLYRDFQNLTNLGHTSPSRDACLRGTQDAQMYRWASTKENLILIAGHTHRPVWSSQTHLDKLILELHLLQQRKPGRRSKDYGEKLEHLLTEVDIRAKKYPPCNDIVKTKSCYYNTGCCRFDDGDITGIEIVDGDMRLVKWGKKGVQNPNNSPVFARKKLESQSLDEIFIML